MATWKEENIYRKQVREGIVSQKSIPRTKKKAVGNWLAVYWGEKNNRWGVWREYITEELARKQMLKMLSYWPMYVVEKECFMKHYSNKEKDMNIG